MYNFLYFIILKNCDWNNITFTKINYFSHIYYTSYMTDKKFVKKKKKKIMKILCHKIYLAFISQCGANIPLVMPKLSNITWTYHHVV